MNIYPGQGLGSLTGILGSNLGQPQPTADPLLLCKIHGVLLDVSGFPVGRSVSILELQDDGIRIIVPSWEGIRVTLSIPVAQTMGGLIVTTDHITVTTEDTGYFECLTLQGLNITVQCAELGKTFIVNTYNKTDIDISQYF